MSNLLKSKTFKVGGLVVAAAMLLAVGAASVSAQNTVTTTTTVHAAPFVYVTTMRVGMSGPGVATMQAALNTVNMGGPTIVVDGKFGPATLAAVKYFQMHNNLVADGVVGPMTGAKLSAATVTVVTVPTGNYPAGCTSAAGFSTTTGMSCSGGSPNLPAGCTSTSGFSPTTGAKCDGGSSSNPSNNGPLSGGAGSITVDDSSEFSDEEVGEDEEDAEVLQFSVEADDESDVEVTSIKVEFFEDGATSSEDLDDYAESVSVWFDGEKVGEADVEDFSEDADIWTETISLDGVVIRAGEEEDLVVAVTSLGNLDTDDINTDAWHVDVLNVRFKDGEGVTTTEDVDADGLEQDFDFESFAGAADTELKVSLTDGEDADEINEAHVIDVDDGDDTDGVELLAFNLEAEGDSDVLIVDLHVNLVTTEAAGTDFDEPGDVVTSLSLFCDGEEVGSESLSGAAAGAADSQTVLFEDVDVTVDAGGDIDCTVEADLIGTDGVLDANDTILAQISATERALIEAEDESGEELATADMTGTAVGEASSLQVSGIMAKFVSTKTTITEQTGADVVNFEIVFDVTAFDTDAFVDGSLITDEAGGATYQDIRGDNFVATGSLESNADDAANSTFEVNEGTTERFTLTVSGVGTGAFAQAALESILWATTAIDGDTLYTFNMGDYESESVFVAS